MKKIVFIMVLFFVFISNAYASDTFILNDYVPDIYIYMNRINKKVYRQINLIYKTDTNELVYCIEPGVKLSNDSYDAYEDYSSIFNINPEMWERVKLVAYYGYNYGDHTDLRWYAVTQYLVWHEIIPKEWELYFVDKNHNKIDNAFQYEIDEIYRLVNNHINNPGLSNNYIFNLNDDLIINGNNNLNNYNINKGTISNNKIYLDNLSIGNNEFTLNYNNYKKPLFYFNSGGQNVVRRGDIFLNNYNFSVYITSGKVKINECNEEDFEEDFIGGIYEVLDQDDEVIDTLTCLDGKECISNSLPVGFHKIRVKELNDKYEKNEHIYDVEITDNNVTNVNICSLKKKIEESRKTVKEEKSEVEEVINISEEKKENEEIIDVPNTFKLSITKYLIFIILFFLSMLLNRKNENIN